MCHKHNAVLFMSTITVTIEISKYNETIKWDDIISITREGGGGGFPFFRGGNAPIKSRYSYRIIQIVYLGLLKMSKNTLTKLTQQERVYYQYSCSDRHVSCIKLLWNFMFSFVFIHKSNVYNFVY